MSRRRERREERGRQRGERRAAVSRPAPRKQTPRRILIPLFVVLVGGTLGMWALVHHRKGAPSPAPISVAALNDSALAAYRGQNPKDALYWARLLVAADPSNPSSVLHLGVVSHNYSFAWSKHGRVRSLTRTSLERIELESRALALMDSAAKETRSDRQWTETMTLGGQVYEALGLPLEALQLYDAACTRVPDHQSALPHVLFIERSLRDPLTNPAGQWAVRTR
jgi:hypothetical protein